jgi:ADP-ribose pyrophosphatase
MADLLETLLETSRFQVVKQTVTRPDGRAANVSYVVHPGSVAILPLIDDDHLCLIRSRRLTVGQTLIEVPAGTREPGEAPLETARRELEEETGYRAARWEELAQFYASPGILSERMHLFVASQLTSGPPRREANEEIENLVLSWDEAFAMLDRGEIVDGKTMIALLTYDRRRQARRVPS